MKYTELMAVDLAKLGAAVADWKRMADDLQRLDGEARDGLKAKADTARWEGVNAAVSRDFVGKAVKEFADLGAEAKSIYAVVDDAYSELKNLQQQARDLADDAKGDGFAVSDGKDGAVVIAEALICSVERTQRQTDLMQWYADTFTGIVAHAA